MKKMMNALVKFCSALTISVIAASVIAANPVLADGNTKALHSALALIDFNTEQVDLIGYQSIDQPIPDEVGATKYIILDFRPGSRPLPEEELVVKVGHICSQIIGNQSLISNLSAMGYDMVSVAFDDQSQFDCL